MIVNAFKSAFRGLRVLRGAAFLRQIWGMSDLFRRLAAGLAIAALVLTLWWLHAFDWLQQGAMNVGARARAVPPCTNVLVVGIDSDDVSLLGPLPWPRRRYADAIQALNAAGAESIALDMWFPEAAAPAADDLLRQAAQRAGNVFVGLFLAEEKPLVKVTRSNSRLVRGAMSEAHVNVIADSDGQVRRVPWEKHTLSERFLFMPVALAARHFGVKPEEVRAEQEVLGIGKVRLPLETQPDGSGAFLVDLPDTSDYFGENYLTFRDVVNGHFKTEQVRGKIVLIGQVIVGGGYADTWETARGRKFGVILLSEITQQILDGRSLVPAPKAWTLLLVLMLALSGAFLFYPRHAMLGFGAHLVLLVFVWAFFFIWMVRPGRVLEPAPLTAAVIGSLALGMVRSLRSAGHELVQDARAMEILHRLSETLVSSAGMPTIVTGQRLDVSQSFVLPGQTPQVLLQTIAEAVGARQGALFVSRQPRPGLTRIASLAGDGPLPAPEFADRVNQRLLQSGRAFASCDPARDLAFAATPAPDTLLAMPLSFKSQVMGAVHLYGKRATEASPGERFTPADLRLVAIMAQQTMIGLENASLYEGMRSIFMSATLALANAVDAKDPYTRGHSERVLSYSEQLARAMSLPPQDVESIKMAAVLHDIGKIAIPDEILRKPGTLTAEEFDLVRTHPARGEAILAPLEELRPLRPGIRNHHERFDGRGYPDRLAGKDIPLHARIICVADSFDAMTSKRYYHEAKSLEEGLEEIARCSGAQFDPELAECFIHAFRGRAPVPVLPQAAFLAMANGER
jgi:HD-GYP domain-containing protein (c-di-GMP phosphodiesterase class II)/CHASE2 domain-containing sensor protein